VGGTTILAQIINQHTHVVQRRSFPTSIPLIQAVCRQYLFQRIDPQEHAHTPRAPTPIHRRRHHSGHLYVNHPIPSKFRGNVNLQGFIVFENKNTSAVNVIDMRANFKPDPSSQRR